MGRLINTDDITIKALEENEKLKASLTNKTFDCMALFEQNENLKRGYQKLKETIRDQQYTIMTLEQKEGHNDMGDVMQFPNDVKDFIKDYSFKDSEEIYTNGSQLIPVFRVEQMIEHYFKARTDTCKNQSKNVVKEADEKAKRISKEHNVSNLHAECYLSNYGNKEYCGDCGSKEECKLIEENEKLKESCNAPQDEKSKNEPVRNSDEFEVGDWVIPYGKENDSEERYLIESIDGDLLKVKYQWGTRGWGHAEFYKSDVFIDTECIACKMKRTKLPKEEPPQNCSNCDNKGSDDCQICISSMDKNGKITSIPSKWKPKESQTCVNYNYGDENRHDFPCVDCLEHDRWEPMNDTQKTDNSQVEWVWEAYSINTNNKSRYAFEHMDDALRKCEELVKQYPDIEYSCRKVCRRKE